MSVDIIIESLSRNCHVEEAYVLVREAKLYLNTGDESFSPLICVKVFKSDILSEAYHYTVSHHVNTPIQAAPYFSSRSTSSSEVGAFREAIDSTLHFISLAIEQGYEPDDDWLVPNDDY